MIAKTIDLYREFSLPKKENYEGTLDVICVSHTEEMGNKLRPAMLVVAGGGYYMTSSREMEPVAMQFLPQGYCCFILHYTVQTAYPVPLVEAAMAMAYIRKHAKEYEVDPAHVCAVGFSAGAHLTGMLATLYGAPELECLHVKKELIRPDAVILSYGVLTTGEMTHGETAQIISGGDEELKRKLSLEKLVTKDCPPAFLWHTVEDDCVPVLNSVLYAEACMKAGVPVELHLFEKGWHGVSIVNAETERDSARLSRLRPLKQWVPLALTWLEGRGFLLRCV